MEYMSCVEAAAKWGISERRVQKLCEENRIPVVVRFSRIWIVPKDASKPADGRKIIYQRKGVKTYGYYSNCRR